MYQKVHSDPDIYSIFVPLPDNPLKNLNSYLIVTRERNLLIDTGFRHPRCLYALLEGLREVGADLRHTDLFLTHMHSDHAGLASGLLPPGSRIYMGRTDYHRLLDCLSGQEWARSDASFLSHGFPAEFLQKLTAQNPARAMQPLAPFPAQLMDDGDAIQVGPYRFTCVLTPGHTPGHMCLYCADRQLMLLGDHILFDISPNITAWEGVEDSLGDYLASLRRVRSMEVRTALPAHRKGSDQFIPRIDTLLEHHERRLAETLSAVTAHPHADTYHLAACLTWSMRGRCWDDFPISQRWFATGETVAHLDRLRVQGAVSRQLVHGIWQYSLA